MRACLTGGELAIGAKIISHFINVPELLPGDSDQTHVPKAPEQPSHYQIPQAVPADKEIDVVIGDTSLAAVTTSMVYRYSGCRRKVVLTGFRCRCGQHRYNPWADQWDYRDELAPTSKKSSEGKKNDIEKTKEVAATGLKKAKQGTTVGFNWIKE
ncbi:Zinc finger A20 and AN1 domain-containing stress-associated protein 11 [Platanthera guangdongensis]|uniref:Zinc finger A20 and AN1 domain-containing stress-associated protein 11 n=1 Tax=Platanthera guangdongensis TaxID=2320717 RepID=A0ABR2MUD4_9ASPA